MNKKQLYAVLSSGFLASSLILCGGLALAQPMTPQQPPAQLQPSMPTAQPQQPPPPPAQLQQLMPQVQQPVPSLEKKPAETVEKKPAKATETVGKKLVPRLNCGPGWRQFGEMSCEAVKPTLQCPPGTNYFEGQFVVGCR